MAATIKDLGKVTAYAYAKAAGYTGTEEQFQAIFNEFTENAPGLMDRMDTAVARAEAAVADIDATVQDAVDQAVGEATASAVATANQAVTDAQAAQTAAEGAVTQANAAVTQANSAVAAAQAAQGAAEDAAASFVLDRTLTDSGAAAPADLVGDLKSALANGYIGTNSAYPQILKNVSGVMLYRDEILQNKIVTMRNNTYVIIDSSDNDVYLFRKGLGWVANNASKMCLFDKQTMTFVEAFANNAAANLATISEDAYLVVNSAGFMCLDFNYTSDGVPTGMSRELDDIPVTDFSVANNNIGIASVGGANKAFAPFRFNGDVTKENATRFIIYNLDGTYSRNTSANTINVNDEIVAVVTDTPETAKITLNSASGKRKTELKASIDTIREKEESDIKEISGVLDELNVVKHNVDTGILETNVLYANDEIIMADTTAKYYRKYIHSISTDSMTVGDIYSIKVDSAENVLVSKPVVIYRMDESGNILQSISGAVNEIVSIVITQSILDDTEAITFALYPATTTPLSSPAIFTDVVIFKSDTWADCSVTYAFQTPLRQYIEDRTGVFDSSDESVVSSYTGERIDVSSNRCKLLKVMDLAGEFAGSTQAGTNYGNYFFQFFDEKFGCNIYDLEHKTFIQSTTVTDASTWHNNSASFGSEFYDENDEFPVVYLGEIDDNCVVVARIVNDNGVYSLLNVQKISWNTAITLPEACIDIAHNRLIRIGYTESGFVESPTNKIVVTVFNLPSLSAGDIVLNDTDAIESFELPFKSSFQGCFYHNDKIYIAFGSSETATLRVIDMSAKQFVTEVLIAVPAFGTLGNAEPEGLFLWNGHICCNTVRKQIWKMLVE